MRGKESVKKRKGGFNIQSIIMSVLMVIDTDYNYYNGIVALPQIQTGNG